MLTRLLVPLASVLVLSLGSEAESSSPQAICESLDRGNIDCGCVATRIDTFAAAAPTEAGANVVLEGYRAAAGLDHDLGGAMASVHSNPMNFIDLEQALSALGGRPQNIEDYENGCVVPDASPVEFKLPEEAPVVEYTAACTELTGDRRYCSCLATRKRSRVSAPVFEAYYRSFSQYDDENFSLDDMQAARAEKMGVSEAEFASLLNDADRSIRAYDDVDMSYCSAMLWADERPGNSPAERKRGGFDADQAAVINSVMSDEPDASVSDGLTAETLIENGCSAQGNSESYCACYMRDYQKIAAPQMPNEDAALAWALLNFGDTLPQMEFARLMQELPQSAQQSAVMMTMSTSQVGETCTQGASSVSEKLTGSARSRMMKVCIAENEDQALCNCMVDQMEEKLSPSDFELMVDLREAEYRGIEDPLSYVAEERGLTREQAEQGLGTNQALTGGIMNMDLMACIGSMPGGIAIPGFDQ